jgi:uncharacterized protein YcbK (DUF882 family)
MKRRDFMGCALGIFAPAAFAAKQDPKFYTLSFHHTHTSESLYITYRIGENYQTRALKKLNYFLRDHHTDAVTVIDPRLFDLLHALQHKVGNPDGTFEVVSGYRSPQTNARLRKASKRVAKRSLHMKGQALDVRLRKTKTSHLRDAAVQLRQGGVGYYRRSDFVHVDTGQVRRWGA